MRVEKTEPFSQGEEKFQNVNHSPREKRVLIKLDKIKNLGNSLQILRVELFSPREKRSFQNVNHSPREKRRFQNVNHSPREKRRFQNVNHSPREKEKVPICPEEKVPKKVFLKQEKDEIAEWDVEIFFRRKIFPLKPSRSKTK